MLEELNPRVLARNRETRSLFSMNIRQWFSRFPRRSKDRARRNVENEGAGRKSPGPNLFQLCGMCRRLTGLVGLSIYAGAP